MPEKQGRSYSSFIIVLVVLAAAAFVVMGPHKKSEKAPVSIESAGLPRMVELGSTLCTSCKEMAKIMAKLEPKYKGRADFIFIDVDKYPEKAEAFKVQMIPTQVFQDAKGKEVWRHVGFLEQEKIEAQFKEMGVK